MRVRLKSALANVSLNCWYEIPQKSQNAYIEDLIKQLHSDLDLDFSASELALEVEDFDLPRRSRIEGVVREGDVLLLKKTLLDNGLIDPLGTSQFGRPTNTHLIKHVASAHAKEGRSRPDRPEIGASHVFDVVGDVFEMVSKDISDLRAELHDPQGVYMNEFRQALFPGLEEADVAALPGQINDLVKTVAESSAEIKRIALLQEDDYTLSLNMQKRSKNKRRKVEKQFQREFQALKAAVVLLKEQILAQSRVESMQSEHTQTTHMPNTKSSPAAKTLFAIGDASSSSSSSEDGDEESDEDTSDASIASSSSLHAREGLESDGNSSTTSSSATTSTLTTSSSSEVEEISSKLVPYSGRKEAAKGIPFRGSAETATRNDRRKRRRLLQNLIAQGLLPEAANFRLLSKYLEAREAGQYLTLEQWQQVLDEIEVQRSKPSNKVHWDYPAVPEPGWENRLVVKEIECETNYEETRMQVEQYETDTRSRKRRRPNDENTPLTTIASQDVVLEADMYGDAIVTNGVAPVIHTQVTDNRAEQDAEDGEVIEESTSAPSGPIEQDTEPQHEEAILLHSPSPPVNLGSLPRVSLSSPLICRGAIIAFKHMEMINFAPRYSGFKTAKILENFGNLLLLELAKRDLAEPTYDYEGDRVHGPFDVVDYETGKVSEGRMQIEKEDLIDVTILARAKE